MTKYDSEMLEETGEGGGDRYENNNRLLSGKTEWS